jgi:hypothetical protein
MTQEVNPDLCEQLRAARSSIEAELVAIDLTDFNQLQHFFDLTCHLNCINQALDTYRCD